MNDFRSPATVAALFWPPLCVGNALDLFQCLCQVGVNASSVAILEHLIRADTASAFNISVGDVNVTGISQVGCRHCNAPFKPVIRQHRPQPNVEMRLGFLVDTISMQSG
jgi:hypothetical protein